MVTETMYDTSKRAHLIAYCKDKTLYVYDTVGCELIYMNSFSSKILHMTFTLEGIFLYLLLKNGTLYVLDTELLKLDAGDRYKIKSTEGTKEKYENALLLPFLYEQGTCLMVPGSRYQIPLNDYYKAGTDGKYISMFSQSREMFGPHGPVGRSLLVNRILNDYEKDEAYVLYGDESQAILLFDLKTEEMSYPNRYKKDSVILCHASLKKRKMIGLIPYKDKYRLCLLSFPKEDEAEPEIEKELCAVPSKDGIRYHRKSSFLLIESEDGRKILDLETYELKDNVWPKKVLNQIKADNILLVQTSSAIELYDRRDNRRIEENQDE